MLTDGEKGSCKVRLFETILDYRVGTAPEEIPEGIRQIVDTVVKDYAYLLSRDRRCDV